MRSALLAFLVLAVAGCSGPLVRNAPDAGAPADFPNHTAAQILYQVAQSQEGIKSYRSEARMAVESPQMSQSAGASIRASRADSLYASLRGPLNLNIGRALITADSFFAVDQLNNRYLFGPLTVAERYVVGAGEPGALARNVLGLVVPAPEVNWTVRPEAETYILTAPDGRTVYVVDPSVWRVMRVEEMDDEGTVYARRQFEAFDVVDGFVVPRRVVLAAPLDASALTIEHQRLTLNPDDLGIRFRVPSDAERIPLE